VWDRGHAGATEAVRLKRSPPLGAQSVDLCRVEQVSLEFKQQARNSGYCGVFLPGKPYFFCIPSKSFSYFPSHLSIKASFTLHGPSTLLA